MFCACVCCLCLVAYYKKFVKNCKHVFHFVMHAVAFCRAWLGLFTLLFFPFFFFIYIYLVCHQETINIITPTLESVLLLVWYVAFTWCKLLTSMALFYEPERLSCYYYFYSKQKQTFTLFDVTIKLSTQNICLFVCSMFSLQHVCIYLGVEGCLY